MPKPHATLLLIGPRGHGKTSLAAGLRRASRADDGLDERPREQVIALPRGASVTVALVATDVESTRRRYTLLDPGEPRAARKRLIAGASGGLAAVDGAVLVVEAGRRCEPELLDDLRLLRRVGAAGLVVFLGRAVDEDPEFVDLAERELRVELCAAGIDGDAAPIVRGSLSSLRDGEAAGTEAAHDLYDALDRHVTDRVDERPRLAVATILATDPPEVECRVVGGALEPDEQVELVGVAPTRFAQVAAVVAAAPDGPTRCALRGVTAGDLRVGQVLALPGTFAAHHRLEAEVWFFAPRARRIEEWQLVCHGVVAVGGLARPIKDSRHGFEVELASALALTSGDGFVALVEGQAVGVGVVVAVRGATRKRRSGALTPTGLAIALVDSLHRGDRPDITASLLLPPEEVLRATAPGFAADLRDDLRSGRILARLLADGHGDSARFVHFGHQWVLERRGSVEYVGPCTFVANTPRQLARGASETVYMDHGERRSEMRPYRLLAGLTLARVRFPIAVTREGVRELMLVGLSIAEFEVRRGVWFVFDFVCPYSWQGV